jgi:hypothetical protein
MTTRHAIALLPTSGAARLGRSRTLRHGTSAFMRRQNVGNTIKVATQKPLQRPPEHDAASNPPCHNIPARSQIGVPHRAAPQLSP